MKYVCNSSIIIIQIKSFIDRRSLRAPFCFLRESQTFEFVPKDEQKSSKRGARSAPLCWWGNCLHYFYYGFCIFPKNVVLLVFYTVNLCARNYNNICTPNAKQITYAHSSPHVPATILSQCASEITTETKARRSFRGVVLTNLAKKLPRRPPAKAREARFVDEGASWQFFGYILLARRRVANA